MRPLHTLSLATFALTTSACQYILGLERPEIIEDGGIGNNADAADPPPPSMGEASIQVSLEGTPSPDLIVLFFDKDGALTVQTTTDSAGLASATIGRDSMITVAHVEDRQLLTFVDVQPFEQLVVTSMPPLVSDSDKGSVTMTSSDVLGSEHFYHVSLGSDFYVTSPSSPLNVTLDIPTIALNAEGKFNVVVTEYDEDSELESYGIVTDITPESDGTTAVTVPPPFSRSLPDLSVSITEAPVDSETLRVESYNVFDGLFFAWSAFGRSDITDVTDGSAALTVPYLGALGQVEAQVFLGLTGSAQFTWVRRRPRPAPPIALDAGDLPPRLTATLDTTTPTQPVLTWTADGDTSGGDTIMARFYWNAADDQFYSWTVYLPPDAKSFQVPALPESVAALGPQASSVYSTSTRVAHVDLESVDGYDAFRSQANLTVDLRILPDAGYGLLPETETGMVYSEVRASLPE